MTYEVITALFIFTLVSTCTPGPNNIMLLASGMNYGVIRTLPHMLGIGLGFPFMVFLVGIGLSQIFEAIPYSYQVMKIISVLYLLYLAWKVATATKSNGAEGKEGGRPLTFLQAASFQWVNPKAWSIAISIISVYTPPNPPFYSVLIVTAVAALSSIPSTSIWTILGHKLRVLINNEKYLRVFNIACALLLVGSLYPVVAEFL